MRGLLRALTLLLAGLIAALTAPSALAAFPGTNGLLVVAPAKGPGLQLVDPHGHGLHTICTDARLCGTPIAPHFSPNGQQIAFGDRKSGRTVVVGTDGTCLWCLLGPPLTKLKGATPAFKNNAQMLSYSSGQNLWIASLTGGSSSQQVPTPTPGSRGPIVDAVWSRTGALAFVRGGSLWLVRPHHPPRNLGVGTQPAFSPDATHLAFVRFGWIWALTVTGAKQVRLVPGSDPAYSPDGRGLAFIAHATNVYIVGARGGRPRLVPGVHARSLDWQPLTTTSSGRCSVPAGATVLAQSAEAIVTYVPGTPQTPWYGCLQATGKRWPLVTVPSTAPGANSSLGQVQLAGRFVSFLLTSTDSARNCTDEVGETDLGSGSVSSLYTLNCTGAARGIDSLGVDTSGFSAWHAHEQIATAQPLTGIACPSSAECVAVDGHGNAGSSSSPGTAGSWSLARVAPGFTGVRCPSPNLCFGLNGGQIITTTNPTGGAGAWNAPVTIDSAPLADLACAPAGTLCVAVDNAGDVVTSTNPTGGAGAWTVTNVDGASFLSGVSCPSSNLCVAVGQNGDVLTSTNPTGGAGTWSHTRAESTPALLGVSCPTTTRCVASDTTGNMLSTTTPATGGPWNVVHVAGESGFISQPVCPSATLCLARDGTGNVLDSTNPTSPTATWTVSSIGGSLSGLSCAPASAGSLCAVSDTAGQVHSTTNPAAGATGWQTTAVDVPGCTPCIAEQVYARDDRATQALDAVQPGPGNVLADVGLGANSTVVSWRHGGVAHSYQLK